MKLLSNMQTTINQIDKNNYPAPVVFHIIRGEYFHSPLLPFSLHLPREESPKAVNSFNWAYTTNERRLLLIKSLTPPRDNDRPPSDTQDFGTIARAMEPLHRTWWRAVYVVWRLLLHYFRRPEILQHISIEVLHRCCCCFLWVLISESLNETTRFSFLKISNEDAAFFIPSTRSPQKLHNMKIPSRSL